MNLSFKKKLCLGSTLMYLIFPNIGEARLTTTVVSSEKNNILTRENSVKLQVINSDSPKGIILASSVLTEAPGSGDCTDKNGDTYVLQTSDGYSPICFENTLSNCRDGQITTTYIPSTSQTIGTTMTYLENCLCEFDFDSATQVPCSGSGSDNPGATGGFSEVQGSGI